jgi:hypothetical protein
MFEVLNLLLVIFENQFYCGDILQHIPAFCLQINETLK